LSICKISGRLFTPQLPECNAKLLDLNPPLS
jgi:hypothetical protein